MKRMLCLFLALILAVGICFSAPVTITASAAETTIIEEGNCGATGSSVQWKVDDTNTLTISGAGAMADYTKLNARPWHGFRTGITAVIIEDGVTVIGKNAFNEFSALQSVIIGNGVTKIGANAFSSCKELVNLTIGNYVQKIGSSAFSSCTKLVEVSFPNYIRIDEITNNVDKNCSVFSGCTSLESVTFAAGISAIATEFFYNCSSLKSITGLKSVESIRNQAFYGCESLESVTFGSSLKSIGSNIFYGCTSLKSINVSNNSRFSSVDGVLFYDKDASRIRLIAYPAGKEGESYTIPDNVTTIGDNAFATCTKLVEVTIPITVSEIGVYAFDDCAKLESVKFPYTSQMVIEYGAFDGCAALKTVEFPDYVGSINKAIFKNCTSLESVTLPEGVGTIGDEFFYNCKSLKSVTIPDDITSIGQKAFYACESLEQITIPDGVETIAENAFDACIKLADITIPDSVKYIGSKAFYHCKALESVTILGSATEIGDNAFLGISATATVNVPCSWNENPKYTTFANSVTVDIQKHNYELGVCTACKYDCTHVNKDENGICTVCYIAEGTCGENVTWIYDSKTTTLTISGSGDMAKFDSRDMLPPWANYRDSIKKVVISDGVTNIATYAFYNCTALKDITIGKNVATLDYSAFLGCSALESITVDENNASYLSEDGILFSKDKTKIIRYPQGKAGEYSIPKGVKTIGGYAFRDCALLTSITVDENNANFSSNEDGILFNKDKSVLICCPAGKEGDCEVPSGVTTIGNNAFSNCVKLQSVTIPVSVTTIGEETFAGCENVNLIVEPGSKAHEFAKTNSIPYIFNGYNEAETAQIEKLTFKEVRNENSEVIGYSVFSCDKEISGALNIPATYNGKPVIEIGSFVFEDCTALSAVTIPKSVTTIGAMAFCRCSSLETITIPKSVTTILAFAFIDCAKLTSIIVDENNINYSNSEDGVLFDKNKENLICYPAGKTETSYTVPESVTKIGEYAFMHCIALTSVTIPESVTTIGSEAFCGCTALETVTISGIETTIGNDAFYDCPNVTLLVDENSNAHAYALEKNIKYITYVGGSGELGKLTFTLNEDGESYSVTGCDTSISGALTIPSTYNGKHVTAIGNSAFSNCKSLTSVVIPDSVVSLGEMAFYSCSRLETIILSNKITEIPKAAFAYCESLKKLPITENVASIGESAFYASGNLGSVSLSNVTIGSSAFLQCGITELTLENCKLNDVSAFINNDIEKLTLSETDIPDEMFYGNAYIKTLSAENSVLGSSAFSDCRILEKVTVSGGEIKSDAFWACPSLETVTIDNIGSVGEYAFYNCQALKTVEVNATEISKYAFSMCTSLENVKLSDGVEVIGNAVFENCTSLAELELPETVTKIGKWVFNGCDLLTELVIPESVAEISDGAFVGCSNLKYIFFEGTEDAQKTIGDALETNAKIHYGSSTHTFNEKYTVDLDPTCTEKGSKSQHCKYCDLTQNVTNIDKLGHTPVKGGTEGVHTICSVCKEPLSTTHNLTSKITTAPTCTEEGVETFTCECGYTYTESVKELGHDKVSHSAKSATCETIGWYAYDTCSRCDYTTYKEIAKLGHDIVIDKAIAATCTETGLTEGSHCTRCDGATVAQQTIAKKGHTEVTVTGKAATCTATGLTDGKKCSVCGTTTVAQQTIAKKAHTEVTVTGKAATCTATGLTDGKKCSVCGTVTKAQQIIKATGHKEVVIPAVAPTYTTVGKTEGKKCSVCGTVTVAQKDVAKLTLATPTVTQKNTAKGIEVNWNKIDGAESYVVYRSVYSGGKWSKWASIKKGVTGTSYVDGTVKLGTSYKYTVRAVNGSVMSGYQNTKDGLKYNVTPTVKVALASNGIKVSWSTAANATGYTVYSSTYNTKTKKWSGWKNRGTVKASKTSWTDKSVKSGTKYRYTVKAMNDKVGSTYNKDGAATLYLAQPTVKIANASTGVKVSWNKVTGATGYTVYRSEYKNGAWTKWASRGTAKANKTSWTDTKVASGVQYKYTVRAINGSVKSTYVASNTVLYLAQPKTTVKAVSNGINVAWTQSTGATGYTVYRMEYNTKTKKWSGWKKMGTAKSSKTNWTDKSAKKGVQYKYTVKAVNGKTASTYKASSSVKR